MWLYICSFIFRLGASSSSFFLLFPRSNNLSSSVTCLYKQEISNLEVKNAGLRDKIKELQQLKDLLLQHVTAHFIKHHLPDTPQSGVGHPPRGLPDAMLRVPRCLAAFDKPETHWNYGMFLFPRSINVMRKRGETTLFAGLPQLAIIIDVKRW